MYEPYYEEDEVELLDQQDIEASSNSDGADSDARSHSSRSDDGRESDDGQAREGEDLAEPTEEQYRQLRSTVVEILSAMGGLEEHQAKDGSIESVYVLGDDVLRCLRDLRTLWKEDEDDESRLIPRIYAEVGVLQNGLIPLVLKATSMGEKGAKVALACTDLLTTLTWPMDASAELRAAHERNESEAVLRQLAALVGLERQLVTYKAAILRTRSGETRGSKRDVLSAVMLHVLLPSLSKPRPSRTERDTGTISMCLHLFRNLLAIREPPATTLSSTEAISLAQLQSELVVAMQRSHVLETLLTLASSAETRELEPWSAITAECIWHLFAGTKPAMLVPNSIAVRQRESQEREEDEAAAMRRLISAQRAEERAEKMCALSSTLSAEANVRRAYIRTQGSSRHSRFGTSINFTSSEGTRGVARSQTALRKTSEELRRDTLERYQRRVRRRQQVQEVGAPTRRSEWTRDARMALTRWADRFVKSGFEPLIRAVSNDIYREVESKLGDVDEARVRFMQLLTFFLEYFLLQRQVEERHRQAEGAKSKALLSSSRAANVTAGVSATDKGKAREIDEEKAQAGDASAAQPLAEGAKEASESAREGWPFGLVAYCLDPWIFRLAIMRCGPALAIKDRKELISAAQLWTTALRLVDAMAQSSELAERQAAEGIQAAIYYEETTQTTFEDVAKSFTSQSFAYLDSIVTLAHAMPRMLERYASNKEHLFIRAKVRAKKAKAKAAAEGVDDDMLDVDEAAKHEAEQRYTERRFDFQKFQAKLCSAPLARACVAHLQRWREYEDHPSQLAAVVGIMHRFAVKAARVELFFPFAIRTKLRKMVEGEMMAEMEARAPSAARDVRKLVDFVWRRFDKLSEEEKAKYAEGAALPRGLGRAGADGKLRIPAEIKIDPSRGHMEDIGIAVALLMEKEKLPRIMWVKQALDTAASIRRDITSRAQAQSDGEPPVETGEGESEANGAARRDAPPHFEPYVLDYDADDDALRKDATIMPELKLLCRLVGLQSDETNPHSWKWIVPSDIEPDILETDANYVGQYVSDPYQTGGMELREYIKRVVRRKQTTARAPLHADGYSTESDESENEEGDESGDGESGVVKSRKKKASRKFRRLNTLAKRRPAVKRGDFVNDDDLIDSDEELAFADAALAAKRRDAAGSGAAEGSRRRARSSSSASEGRPAGVVRPRATALRAAAVSDASSPPSSPRAAQLERSTPPTSSPASTGLGAPPSPKTARSGRRARPGGALFLGDSDEEEEEDQLASGDDEDADRDEHGDEDEDDSRHRPRAARWGRGESDSASPSRVGSDPPSPARARAQAPKQTLKRPSTTASARSESLEGDDHAARVGGGLVGADKEEAEGDLRDGGGKEGATQRKRRRGALAIFSDEEDE